MPVAATDLIAPTGALTVETLTALQTALEPAAESPTAVASAYLAAAVAKVDALTWTDTTRRDRAVVAWATYSALSQRAQQILTGVMSASGDREGSVSYSAEQAKELQRQAVAWLTAYEGVLAEEVVPPVANELPTYDSRAVRTVTAW